MVGSRYAMYMGAVLLVVGAVFVFVRAQRQESPVEQETSDDRLRAIDGEQLVYVRSAGRPAAALLEPAATCS